jgi:hypothetical protein
VLKIQIPPLRNRTSALSPHATCSAVLNAALYGVVKSLPSYSLGQPFLQRKMDQADKRPVRHSSEAFNVHTGASEATAPDTARSAGYIPLTALVGTVTAVIVLVVAAVTFAITYTTSLETVEKIGERLATSLVTIARTKAEDVFNVPANTAIGLKLMALEPGMVLPVEDPTGFTVLNRTVEHIKAHVLSRASDYAVYAVIFDDGSSAAVRHHNESILIAFAANAKKAVNASCCADFWTVDFNYPSMRPTPYAVSSRATQGDNRQVFYQILKGLLQYSQTGYWAPQFTRTRSTRHSSRCR